MTAGARELSPRYPVWLCDVWGVVHNGVAANEEACAALAMHRASGGTVVLITNAPRPSHVIVPQLRRLGAPDDAYDAIVSSGDVTRALVEAHKGRNVFHLGPKKDLALLEGLAVTFTGMDEADVVLCSGLVDDLNEQPHDYDDLLADLARRGLPMVCANPDKVVRYGDRLIPCAGALAERYEKFGGAVAMAGKPFAPIYDQAIARASQARGGEPVERRQVLAIGDGLATDVAGAARNGLDILFIVDGIHVGELDGAGEAALKAKLQDAAPGINVAGMMRALAW